MAKDGATIPKIDLETGEQSENMERVCRTYQRGGFIILLPLIMLGLAYYFILNYRSPELVILFVGIASILIISLGSWKSSKHPAITVWEHISPSSNHGRVFRKRLRGWIGWVETALLFGWALPSDSPSWILAAAILLMVSNKLWAHLDKGITRTLPGPPGWLVISPIHPCAFTFLSELQREES
jgi:hypothetical protein